MIMYEHFTYLQGDASMDSGLYSVEKFTPYVIASLPVLHV